MDNWIDENRDQLEKLALVLGIFQPKTAKQKR